MNFRNVRKEKIIIYINIDFQCSKEGGENSKNMQKKKRGDKKAEKFSVNIFRAGKIL